MLFLLKLILPCESRWLPCGCRGRWRSVPEVMVGVTEGMERTVFIARENWKQKQFIFWSLYSARSLDEDHTCIAIIQISSRIRWVISVLCAGEVTLTHHSWNLEKKCLFHFQENMEKAQEHNELSSAPSTPTQLRTDGFHQGMSSLCQAMKCPCCHNCWWFKMCGSFQVEFFLIFHS